MAGDLNTTFDERHNATQHDSPSLVEHTSLQAAVEAQATIIANLESRLAAVESGDPDPPPPPPPPAPKVVASNPVDGSAGITRGFSPSVTFDQDIDPATVTTGTVLIRDAAGNPVAAVVSYNATGKTAIVNPNADLAADAAYKLEVTVGVESTLGVALAAPFEAHFTTEAAPVVTPPPTLDIVGYGRIIVLGETDATPDTLTELRTLCGQNDKKIHLTKPFDLGGELNVTGTRTQLLGIGEASMLSNGWLRVNADDVAIRNVAAWAGDGANVSVDADSFNANGSGANPIERLVVDHCLFMWGPDVTAVFLNNIADFTMQYTAIAEGLYLSKHPEATTAEGGHSMGLNVTNIAGPGQPAPTRGTIYRCGILNCADRNGRFMGSSSIDLVETLLFGWKSKSPQGFHGAPKAMNVVNNLIRSGSQSTIPIAAFTPATSGDEPNIYPDAVYVAGNKADGFTFKSVSSPAFRSTPKSPLSVSTTRPPTLEEALGWLGPTPQGTHMQRIAADVRSRTSVYVNGTGKGGKSYTTLL